MHSIFVNVAERLIYVDIGVSWNILPDFTVPAPISTVFNKWWRRCQFGIVFTGQNVNLLYFVSNGEGFGSVNAKFE
jgi:hypothetical protein